MYTRQQYMDKQVSHDEYYKTLADAAGIGNFDDAFLDRVRKCIEQGDEHLNNIALSKWDNMCIMDRHNAALRDELKRRNDQLSLSTGVCMRKAKSRFEAMR